MCTAKSYRKALQHSPSPPCPCLSWKTTNTTTRTTRPPRREIILSEAGETTAAAFTALLVPTREACGSFWHRLTMTALQTQHLHLTPRPQPHSPPHPCCPQTALTPPWLLLQKNHISLICRPHLPQQGASRSSCPPWCTLLTSGALLTQPQTIWRTAALQMTAVWALLL